MEKTIRIKNTSNIQSASIKAQFLFILPLTLSVFLILFTHTLFNSGLTRLPDPEIHIAAFAVAKSLMHIFQSPLIMTRQTVTAIANNNVSYNKIRNFIMVIIFIVVASLGIVALTGLSRIVFNRIMGLEGKTLDTAVTILKIVIIFPGMVGIRDFLSALCIKLRVLKHISFASFMRVIYVILFISLLDNFSHLSGAVLVGLMFLGSIFVEVLFLLISTAKASKKGCSSAEFPHPKNIESKSKNITYKSILYFFSPLAFTAYVQTFSMPIINSGLARTETPEITISVFALTWFFGAMIFSPLMVFHQIPLQFACKTKKNNLKNIRKFALLLSTSLCLITLLISFTQIGYFMIHRLIGASHEISILSIQVLKYMSVLPFLFVIREYFWGLFMKNRLTKYVGAGKAVNVIVLVISVFLFLSTKPENPAVIAIISFILAEISESLFLIYVYLKNKEMIDSL